MPLCCQDLEKILYCRSSVSWNSSINATGHRLASCSARDSLLFNALSTCTRRSSMVSSLVLIFRLSIFSFRESVIRCHRLILTCSKICFPRETSSISVSTSCSGNSMFFLRAFCRLSLLYTSHNSDERSAIPLDRQRLVMALMRLKTMLFFLNPAALRMPGKLSSIHRCLITSILANSFVHSADTSRSGGPMCRFDRNRNCWVF